MSLTNIRIRHAAGPMMPPGFGTPAEPERLTPEMLAALVLIIEDEAMIAWMLESLLEDMGFTAITIVATGQEALAAAGQLKPGLIVSDINLGPIGFDGIKAAATIRQSLPAPVLFVTAHAGADALERIREDVPGALILPKPLGSDALRQAVVDLVARRPLH